MKLKGNAVRNAMSDVPLKDYVDYAISGERESRREQLAQMRLAVDLARDEVNRRLGEMNELRAQINKERADFLGREVFETNRDALEKRIREMENFKSNIDGRILMLGGLFTVLNLVIGGIMLWIQLGHK